MQHTVQTDAVWPGTKFSAFAGGAGLAASALGSYEPLQSARPGGSKPLDRSDRSSGIWMLGGMRSDSHIHRGSVAAVHIPRCSTLLGSRHLVSAPYCGASWRP